MKKLLPALLNIRRMGGGIALALLGLLSASQANAWEVTFTKPSNWSSVNAYAWGPNNNIISDGWPGTAISASSGSVYTYSGTGTAPTWVIFSDNGNNQTPDFTFVDGCQYSTTTVGGQTMLYVVGNSINGESNWGTKFAMGYDSSAETYIGKLESLGDQFKIYNGGWSNNTYNIGSNGSPIQLNQIYNYAENGGNISLPNSTDVFNNVTVTLNLSAKTILLTAGSTEQVQTKIYLMGLGGDWADGQELTSEDGNVFTGTFNVSSSDEFKVKIISNWFGPMSSSVAVITPNLTGGNELEMNSNDIGQNWSFNNWSGGNVTFTVNESAKKLYLSYPDAGDNPGTGDEDNVPTALYFIGDTYAYDAALYPSWDPTKPIAFTKSGDTNVFTLTGVELKGTDNKAYFNFLNTTGDWASLSSGNPFRYGPENPETQVTVNTPTDFTLLDASVENSWYIADGVYDFSVDFDNNTFTVTASTTAPFVPDLGIPANLYILGNIEGYNWTSTDTPALTSSEAGVFTISNVKLVTTDDNQVSYFTFINELTDDWDVINDGGHRYGPSTNGSSAQVSPATNEFEPVTDSSWTIEPGTYDFTVDFNEFKMTITKVEPQVEMTTVTFYVMDGEDSESIDNPYEYVNIWNETASSSVTTGGNSFTFDFSEETTLRIEPDSFDYEVVVTAGEYNDPSTYTLEQNETQWFLTLQPGSEDQEFTITVYVAGEVPGETQNVEVSFNVSGVEDAASKFEAYYYGEVNEEFGKQVIDVTEGVSVPANTNITLVPNEGYTLNVECYNDNASVSAPSEGDTEWNVSIDAGGAVMLNVEVIAEPQVEMTTVTFYVMDGDDSESIDDPYEYVNIWNETASSSVPTGANFFTFDFSEETTLRIEPDSFDYEVVVTAGEYNDPSTYTLEQNETQWFLTLQPGSEDQEFTITVYVAGEVPGETQNVEVNFNVSGVADAASKFEAYYYGEVNEVFGKQVIDVTEGVSVPANTNITLVPNEGYTLNVECYNDNASVSAPSEGDTEWNVSIDAGDAVMLNVEVIAEPQVEMTTVTFYVMDGDDSESIDDPYEYVNIWNETASSSVATGGNSFTFDFSEETTLRIEPDSFDYEVVVTAGEYNDPSTYTLEQNETQWFLTLQPGSEDQEFTITVYVAGEVPGETQNVEVSFNVSGVADAASKFEAYYYGEVNEVFGKQVIDVNAGVSVPANTNITLEPKEGYVLNVECYQPNGIVSEPSDELGEWNVSIEAGDPVMLNVTVSTAPANVSINFESNSAGAMPSNFVNVSTQPDINFIVTGNENSLVIPSDGVTLTVTPTDAYVEDGDEYVITSVVVTKDDVEVPAADYADYGVTLTGDMEEWVLSLTTAADGLVFTFYVETSEYVGVNSLNAVDKDAVIYNLQGVRVNANGLTKGIYIINGKKVLVK